MAERKGAKYSKIKQSVIHNIEDDIYAAGQMLPSERELIDTFGVSRITVRHALAELEAEGYIYRVQGKGSFVKGARYRQDLFSLTSCTQDIIRQGMSPSRKVIACEVTSPNKRQQDELCLKEDDKVFRLKRVYLADDEPVNLTTTYLPYKYIEGIERFDFSKTSLYDVLETKFNIKITRATRIIEAVSAHDQTAELLQVAENMPVLLFRCVIFGEVDGKEIPIESFKCYYRSDRFSFCINQVR